MDATTDVVDEPANRRFCSTDHGIHAQLVYRVRDDRLIPPEPRIERAT